jgi:hypothetical protein
MAGNGVSSVQSRKTGNLTPKRQDAQKGSNKLNNGDRSFKGLHTPDFSDNKKKGAVVIDGEADSVLYLGQDARYGTTLTTTGSGGDFANKVVLGVGFLNEGKKDGDKIDLSKPDLRYGAGLTIYQKTDTGKDAVIDTSDPKNKDRKATTRSPQTAVSVFEVNADVIEVKARNGGVNIIAGYDPTLPNYGSRFKNERSNTDYVGVSLIFGNPDEKTLKDEKSVFGLQPIVKGYALEKRMREVSSRISDVNKVLLKVIKAQKALDTALALHVHPIIPPLSPVTLPSIDLAIAIGAVKTPLDIFNVLRNITAKYNQVALRINTSDISQGGFSSKFNFTN